MDSLEKTIAICFVAFCLFLVLTIGGCIQAEKTIQTEAIKAGLHQEVVLKPGQSAPRVIWVK